MQHKDSYYKKRILYPGCSSCLVSQNKVKTHMNKEDDITPDHRSVDLIKVPVIEKF